MTHIEEIEANVAEAKTRQDVNDSGLLAVLIASDIPYLLSEVKRMREALRTARGQIVGFSIKEIGSEAAVQNVKYIDDLLKGTQS